MTAVTISPKYQVVIPKQVREQMNLNVGLKFEVLAFKDRIELIPIRPLRELKGSLKGINTTITREKDRI